MSTPTLAFAGDRLLARGDLVEVAAAVRASDAHRNGATVLLFDADTGAQFDVDWSAPFRREADAEVSAGAGAADAGPGETADAATDEAPRPRRRGRPRLGVVGREVTLLPRHWAWLETQRGGASATLRRLVDAARRADTDGEVRRRAQERTQRLMGALAGDQAGFEEAARALWAADGARFAACTEGWPEDVRSVVRELAADAFSSPRSG